MRSRHGSRKPPLERLVPGKRENKHLNVPNRREHLVGREFPEEALPSSSPRVFLLKMQEHLRTRQSPRGTLPGALGAPQTHRRRGSGAGPGRDTRRVRRHRRGPQGVNREACFQASPALTDEKCQLSCFYFPALRYSSGSLEQRARPLTAARPLRPQLHFSG